MGLQILVVDDDQLYINSIIELLKFGDNNIDFADSGQKALDKVKQKTYGLIYMDHNMPGIKGIEVIKIMTKKMYISSPIYLLTGNDITKSQLDDAGAAGIIKKGDDPKEIIKITNKYKK